ncbi:hypothetical protein [Actinoplanes sp. HUAS TT8]|uniref:hypothetical protein n=1 Tax=Actinoplanes sp. HUAS TT8 TaxID=3447453 RepID=UPI003F5252F9
MNRRWRALAAGLAFARRRVAAQTRDHWVRWVTAGVLGGLLVAGLALAVGLGSWRTTVADVAVNVAASAIVALAAVVLFVIGTRHQALKRLLRYQRQTLMAPGRSPENRPNQARAVVAQLRDGQRHASVLVEAPAGSSRASFIQDLEVALVRAGIVAVVVPEHRIDQVGVVPAATERFRQTIVGAGVNEVPLLTVLEALARRRRVVMLIDGLDGLHQPMDRRSITELTASRIADLMAADLPFLATVDLGSTPEEWEGLRVVLAAVDQSATATVFAGGLAADPNRSVAERKLAIAMQHSLLELPTVLPQTEPGLDTLENAADRLERNGALWVLLDTIDQAGRPGPATGTSWLLEHLARKLVLMESTYVHRADLVADLPESARDEIPDLIAELEESGVVTQEHRPAGPVLRFVDAELREAVVGLWFARHGRPYRQSSRRSRTALAAEIVARVRASRDAATVWPAALDDLARPGVLTAAGDAFGALCADGLTDEAPPIDWWHGHWTASNDVDRTTFVRRLPAAACRPCAPFLWSRLTQPEFAVNARLVRRNICRYLGSNGQDSWAVLGPQWTALVGRAEHGRLAWFERHLVQPWPGSAVGSLCWILPLLALTTGESREPLDCLERLAAATVPGGGPERDARPDVGLEISLAEGCKDAAHVAQLRGLAAPEQLWATVVLLAETARSWVSRMVAMQAAFLLAAAEPDRAEQVWSLCSAERDAPGTHPVVRRYLDILMGASTIPTVDLPYVVNRYVWPDDTEALEAAGGELGDEAALILATTTIILNLGEARRRVYDDQLAAQYPRVRSLVDPTMPACLSGPMTAMSSASVPCACPLSLCGPDLGTVSDFRPMSRVFAYRCLSAMSRVSTGLRWLLPWRTALMLHLRRAIS